MFSRKLFVIFILMGGLMGLGAVGFSFFNQLGCEGQFVNVNFSPAPEQEIFGERVIGQSFVAPYDRLNRIDLLLQTYGRRNTHEVTLHLLDISDTPDTPLQGRDLFSTSLNAGDVSDGSWRSFVIPEITDSANKHFFILLTSPTSEPGDAITIGGIDKDAYPAGSTFLGPVAVPADIAFRACFQMSSLEKLQTLSDQLTQNRPSVWSESTFYLLIFIVYGILLGTLLVGLTRFVLR